MRYRAIRSFLFFGLILTAGFAEARSGCCSYHGGVKSNGCGCNDGTSLSATCARYYTCSISNTTCTFPQVLQNNVCVTPPTTCTSPQVLQNNVCVTPPTTCTSPQVLQNNVCVTPPTTCTSPQVLQNNVCVTPPTTCTSPQVLQNNVCVTPPTTCTSPQVLQNNVCVTPPTTCTSPQVLQNNVCVTPPTTCTSPQVLQNNVCVTPNTKPSITPIALEWDAEVGQLLTIPLSVTDAEQDAFQITGKLPKGAPPLSTEYTASNGLPTVDFNWTPIPAQANKVYAVKFKAKETSTTKKLSSLPVTAKVRVWPAGNRDQAYIRKFMVSTTKWTAGNLVLKGKVIFNKLVTAAEKTTLSNRTDWTVNITQGDTGTGTVISSLEPIILDKGGNWTLSNIALVAPFSCNVTVKFEEKLAVRKINGAPKDCFK